MVSEISIPVAVPVDTSLNVSDLLADRVKKTPNLALFAVPEGDGWKDITAKEFETQVIALAKGFIAAGIKPGEKVGFIAKTTYDWTLVDFGLFYAGAVMVPIYETSSAAQIEWILKDSGARALIVESADHMARFDEIKKSVPGVEPVWALYDGALQTLTAGGADVSDADVEQARKTPKSEDLATLIYTSGSTGRPKGCEISHGNFVETTRQAQLALKEVAGEGESTLLFITTAHVFARLISILGIYAGVKTGHQPDTSQLLPALSSFKPSFLLAVPRVFEKVYNSAEQKAEAGGKGKIFRAAAAAGIKASELAQNGEKIPFTLKAKVAVFDKLVFSKLRTAMGGNVKYAVSGSAPLGARLGHFFHTLGVEVFEGWGLTETTAPATVNRVGKSKIGTVGPPLPGVSVRVAEDGELEVKGINVFQGYWNNEAATKDVFDGDWFKTGDIGTIDEDGYVTITGRKKEIIVTAGGKNVAPAALEDPIRANPIISQVVVVGDQKPFISALITLDEEMLPTWLANNGQPTDLTLEQLAQNPAVREEVQKAIDLANEGVSRAESIRKFEILPTQWTEASGHLTPKMSIKRGEILKDFAAQIEDIYSGPKDSTTGVSLK